MKTNVIILVLLIIVWLVLGSCTQHQCIQNIDGKYYVKYRGMRGTDYVEIPNSDTLQHYTIVNY